MVFLKKTALIVFAMLAFASLSTAYAISRQEFSITINEEGFGTVTEKYYFDFANKADSDSFSQAVKDNGQDFLKWRVFDDKISPYFGSVETISLEGFSYSQAENTLELKYGLDNAISQKTSEDSRSTTWKLNQSLLSKFEQGTLIIVPKNITLAINFPQAAELKAELLPPTVQTTKNSMVLKNARVNNLNIQYVIPKPIAQTISLSELASWLKETGLLYVIISALIIITVVAVVKRKTISERIENYIVEHSEISRKDEEEEIEIEE